MGFRRITKKSLRYLIPTFLVLLIIPFTQTRFKMLDPFEDTHIRCVIDLENFEKMSKGYLTGFNYELIQQFALNKKDTADVFLSEDGVNYLDSLTMGTIDIVVMPKEDAPDSSIFANISAIDTSIVWVIKDDRSKIRSLNHWIASFDKSEEYESMYARFFCGFNPYRKNSRKQGIISPYDDLFKKYAPTVGWDWRMLAALSWTESRFKIQVVSPRGAIGLMQIVPRTAKRFGIVDNLNAEQNIKAGAEYLKHIQNTFKSMAKDKDELIRYTLGAYNAGEHQILLYLKDSTDSQVDVFDNKTEELIDSEAKEIERSLDEDEDANVAHKQNVETEGQENQELIEDDDTETNLHSFSGIETAAHVKAVLSIYNRFCSLTQNKPAAKAPKKEEKPLLSSDSLSRVDSGDEHTRDK